ncbi:MAG: hypothetical protein A3J24_00870 [Deltaproteobacteria bacterium RIFCSPLOWO2_02_FULL_53_8]|nr:MAG: hypothetical protein A3J24_00870 [Deltaproteobacteria bacterium RIFCSPLOWO2_02_FULL_53_8]
MEIRRYWEILLKRKIIFLIIFLSFPLFAFVLMKVVTPVYFSQAKVWIRTNALQQGFLADMPSSIGKLEFLDTDNAMGSIEELLESRQVVGAVVADMGLKNSKGTLYKNDEFIDVGAFKLLKQKQGVDIENLADSEVFSIVGYSDKPDEAREIAERVVKNFKVELAKVYKNASSMALETSRKRLKEMNEELVLAEKAVADFKVNNGAYVVSSQITTLLSEKSGLEIELASQERSLESARSSLAALKKALDLQPEYKRAQITLAANPIIVTAKQAILTLETDRAKTLAERTPEHPDVKNNLNAIEALKNIIAKEVETTLSSQVEQRNTYYETLVTKLSDAEIQIITVTAVCGVLKSQIDDKSKKLKDLPSKDQELNVLSRKADNLRSAYNKMDQAAHFMQTAIDINLENGVTIDPPALSSNLKANTYFPTNKKVLYYIGALFAGCFFGLTTVFFLDYVDDTVSGADDVKRSLGEKVLVALPEVKKGQFGNVNNFIPQAFYSGVHDMIANLKLTKDAPIKVVSIVGSGKENGKTVLAGLTAVAFASNGKKTLVVDAIFRNPAMHNLLGVAGSTGLADILEDNLPSRDAIKATMIKNLAILPAGKPVKDPLRLLASESLEAVIKAVSSDFDVVIIDTASMDAGSDGLILSKYADAAVFVVTQGKTVRKKAKDCLELMKAAKLQVSGVAVNREKSVYSWR